MLRRAPLLKDVHAREFTDLRDGGYRFAVIGPSGGFQSINLYLSGGRKKFRLAQFDLWPSEWNVREDAATKFRQELAPFLDAAGSIPKGTIVLYPSGGSTLTFSVPRGSEGAWLKRAADYITQPENLYPIALAFA